MNDGGGSQNARYAHTRRTVLRLALGTGISLGFLWLAFRGVDWAGAWAVIRHARWGMAGLALGSVILSTWMRALRWRLLFYPDHRRLDPTRCLGIFLAGQVLNAVIPARLGEIARAYLIGRYSGISKMYALWTTVVEKVLDALTLLLFLAGLSLFVPLPPWLQRAGRTLGLALIAGSLLLALLLVLRRHVLDRLQGLERAHPWIARLRLRALLGAIGDSVRLLRNPRLAGAVGGWSVAAFGVGAWTNWLVARALDMPLSYGAALLLLAVLQISAIVPIPTSPGRIGLFHYLCILSLAIFGVARESALSYALVLHVIFYLPMTIGGPLALWLETRGQQGLLAVLGGQEEQRTNSHAEGI